MASIELSGVLEAGTLFESMGVQGERSLPRVMKRRYVSMMLIRLDAGKRQGRGDATGGALAAPLAKMVLYYKTHLAV